MRIQIVHPLQKFQWEKGYTKALEGYDVRWLKCLGITSDSADCTIFMWCDENAIQAINYSKRLGKIIVFIRRFEYYTVPLEQVRWDRVSAVVMVNGFLAEGFKRRTGITPHVIYNAVTLEDWTYKERGHGKDIAWVGFVNQKKNLPLALQILAELPRDYRLHIAGAVQDISIVDYCINLAEELGLKIKFYGHVENMDEWLEDKNYILSAAISEGCPNNVLEAMAKGIKPVIHNWPGAVTQFGEHSVFNTVRQAVNLIESPIYSSEMYLDCMQTKFGPSNYARFRELVDEVANG